MPSSTIPPSTVVGRATILFARFEDRPLTFSIGTLHVGPYGVAWGVNFEELVPDDALIRTILEKRPDGSRLELIDGKGRRYAGLARPEAATIHGFTKGGPALFVGTAALEGWRQCR